MSVFAGQDALPAPHDLICSIDDFAEWFGLTLSASDDNRVQTALEIASQEVRAETNQQLTVTTDEDITLKPLYDGQLILPEWPVTGISVLTVDDQAMTDGTDFVWTDRGIVTPLTFCLRGWLVPRTIVVTYTHGWDPLPRDIAGVVLARAKRLYDVPNGQVVESETLGAWSVKYAPLMDGLTLAEKYTLARYASWTNGY